MTQAGPIGTQQCNCVTKATCLEKEVHLRSAAELNADGFRMWGFHSLQCVKGFDAVPSHRWRSHRNPRSSVASF